MRKLKLQVQMTVDGYIAGPNGEMDWTTFNWDNELNKYVNEITEPVDCIVLGRKLAEGFIPYWATVAANPDDPEFTAGKKITDTHKVVFTKTLDKSEWDNTVLAKGDLVDEITNLKKQSKSRKVPFSEECRKHLWSFCNKWDAAYGKRRYVFSSEMGNRIVYRNAYRDFRNCFKAAGVSGGHVHPHTTRHTFACHYIRNGGDVYRLSRLLGHTNVATTSLYLRGLGVEDMYRSQERLTPLSAS